MPDPFSGGLGSTRQEINILSQREEPKKRGPRKEFEKASRKTKQETEREAVAAATLYAKGIERMKSAGFIAELSDSGAHVNHRLLRPRGIPEISGIKLPNMFKPMQDCIDEKDLEKIDALFHPDVVEPAVREFWTPFFRPKDGDSELLAYTKRALKMLEAKKVQSVHDPIDYGHTFDPCGKIAGTFVPNPRVWVPDKSWFDPVLHQVKFEDVFTIFPKAERHLLMLLLGRIGVGRTNHIPPTWDKPVDHTARMAAVIVGKDAGLGKSTLFNGLIAALSKCGFVTHTFRSTEDRFGLRDAALADISYKDDTSLHSLKRFLMSEETKTLITNGMFPVEEKFEKPTYILPKTVFIVNANEWNSKFAYDLDPGIIDRIKLISTYREIEVKKLTTRATGASEGSPDFRPRTHIPWLAQKLGVSVDALYLWCLRLATDYFWEIITDNSDPTVNRLQVEVRKQTSRQRIRFKADVIQALINGMAFAYAMREKCDEFFMPELTPHVLYDYMRHFYFIGVDPSCLDLMTHMKKDWELAGRPSSHYYQGFREIRWESVKKSLDNIKKELFEDSNPAKPIQPEGKTSSALIKEMIEQLIVRDGFKLGGDANYVIEHWANTRFAQDELVEEGRKLLQYMNHFDLERMYNVKAEAESDWMSNPLYSPDNAEVFREQAREEMYKKRGIKG